MTKCFSLGSNLSRSGISRNAHYMVLFKNLTDVSKIMALPHEMYHRRTQFFLEAFALATARPHGYMVIRTLPLKISSAHSHRLDETAIGFGYEVFTNTRFRLL
jgi:hypothetical protein